MKTPATRAGITACLLVVGCLPALASSDAEHSAPQFATLCEWMTGSFSSHAQAAADPESYRDIRLHMAPIWTERDDVCWLYVEQAVADRPEQPYRQRVYRVSQIDDDLFESRVFTFANPLDRVGAWRDAKPLADLGPDDLEVRQGCAILMRWTGSNFQGSTLGRLCESSLRGAHYASSEVTITPGMIVSWDRGFDADGRQVWGAESGGYVFLKQEQDPVDKDAAETER